MYKPPTIPKGLRLATLKEVDVKVRWCSYSALRLSVMIAVCKQTYHSSIQSIRLYRYRGQAPCN